MANSRDLDVSGNRFALLQPEQTQGHTDTSASASKRRRRKSAKASTSDRSAESSTSIDGLVLNGRIPLKTVSEVDVLRSNSAEVSSSLDAAATFVLAPGRLERHTDADIPHHTAKRPHASFSFQDPSRGLAESRHTNALLAAKLTEFDQQHHDFYRSQCCKHSEGTLSDFAIYNW